MTATIGAPPFRCAACQENIAENRGHYLLGPKPAPDRVVCEYCVTRPGVQGDLFPECGVTWHDAFAHVTRVCRRGSAAHLLGLRSHIRESAQERTSHD